MSPAGVPRIESLKFPGPAGALEGILRFPSSPPVRAALLCAPHPLHQGTLHSPVVFRAARAFHRRGYATLRFNFRGVGTSTGSFDAGRGEKDDVRAALEFMSERLPGTPVTLMGYSFGSWVGFGAAASDPRIRNLVGIGVPLTLFPFGFLRGAKKPILLVQGSEDAYGPLPALRRLAREIGAEARLVAIPGADHLFTGELERLEETLVAEIGD